MMMSLTTLSRRLALATLAAAILSGPGLAPRADAKTLRFAFQGELKAADPYAINESFSLSVGSAVYEGLIRRKPDMSIEPCLATSWEAARPAALALPLAQGREIP